MKLKDSRWFKVVAVEAIARCPHKLPCIRTLSIELRDSDLSYLEAAVAAAIMHCPSVLTIEFGGWDTTSFTITRSLWSVLAACTFLRVLHFEDLVLDFDMNL